MPQQPQPGNAKTENTDKPKPAAKSGIKSYSEVITKDALSDQGVFAIHKVGDKYYYELPDSLLQRDFLWINRFASLPAGFGGGYVNAGSSVNEQMVVWQKFGSRIVLKTKSYTPVAAKTQTASLDWLLKNAFSSPEWLHQSGISRNIHHASYVENIRSLQARHLNNLLSAGRMARLIGTA